MRVGMLLDYGSPPVQIADAPQQIYLEGRASLVLLMQKISTKTMPFRLLPLPVARDPGRVCYVHAC